MIKLPVWGTFQIFIARVAFVFSAQAKGETKDLAFAFIMEHCSTDRVRIDFVGRQEPERYRGCCWTS